MIDPNAANEAVGQKPKNRELTLSEKLSGVINTLEKNKQQAQERVDRLTLGISYVQSLKDGVDSELFSENNEKAIEALLGFGGLA
jgi:hypothetical protein